MIHEWFQNQATKLLRKKVYDIKGSVMTVVVFHGDASEI